MRELLEELATVDASMAQGLAQTYSLRHESRRLALTLFIQYTQSQGLSPGEVALLLGDAQAVVTEALNFLIGSALRESALTAVDDAVYCGEPVIHVSAGFDDPDLRPPAL